MAAQRQSKIQRYREKKELEARLTDVRRAVDSGQADDEVTRDFYLLNIRRWATVSLEEIESIDQEIEILKKMDFLKHSETRPPSQPARPPMKPFILTKDAVQVSSQLFIRTCPVISSARCVAGCDVVFASPTGSGVWSWLPQPSHNDCRRLV